MIRAIRLAFGHVLPGEQFVSTTRLEHLTEVVYQQNLSPD